MHRVRCAGNGSQTHRGRRTIRRQRGGFYFSSPLKNQYIF